MIAALLATAISLSFFLCTQTNLTHNTCTVLTPHTHHTPLPRSPSTSTKPRAKSKQHFTTSFSFISNHIFTRAIFIQSPLLTDDPACSQFSLSSASPHPSSSIFEKKASRSIKNSIFLSKSKAFCPCILCSRMCSVVWLRSVAS